jgi:hypothetical protein
VDGRGRQALADIETRKASIASAALQVLHGCDDATRRNGYMLRPMNHVEADGWIWPVGAIAWAVDGVICLRFPNKLHAELAFVLAAAFTLAWLFYRMEKR